MLCDPYGHWNMVQWSMVWIYGTHRKGKNVYHQLFQIKTHPGWPLISQLSKNVFSGWAFNHLLFSCGSDKEITSFNFL